MNGGVSNVAAQLDERLRLLLVEQVGQNFGLVLANIDEEIVLAREIVDGRENLGGRASNGF